MQKIVCVVTAPAGIDRGDQRHAVGRRRHLAVAETRAIESRAIAQQPPRDGRIDELRAPPRARTANASSSFPSSTGSAGRRRSVRGRRSHSARARTAPASHRALPRCGAVDRIRARISRSRACGSSGTASAAPLKRRTSVSGTRTLSGTVPSSGTSSSTAADRTPARDCRSVVAPPADAVSEREADAAVNRKERLPVVEADDRVHRAALEQVLPQRRAAVIGQQPGRHQHAHAAVGRGELEHALGEQLVEVRVAVALQRVAAGLAAEGRELARGRPRRVADHGVEPGSFARLASLVEEHLGELQLPMEEPLALRSCRRGRAPLPLQRDRAAPDAAPRIAALNAGHARGVRRSTPAGQNHAAHQASATVRHAASGAASPASSSMTRSLRADDRRGVVRLRAQPSAAARPSTRDGRRQVARCRTAAAATRSRRRPGPGGWRATSLARAPASALPARRW